MTWQLQEAKAKFSQLVQKALDEGPQTVTRHGKEVAVLLSADDYKKLQRPGVLKTLMSGPEGDFELPPRGVQEREIDW
jgi:prevent-host-death family protein